MKVAVSLPPLPDKLLSRILTILESRVYGNI
jgi:hypothetical protein